MVLQHHLRAPAQCMGETYSQLVLAVGGLRSADPLVEEGLTRAVVAGEHQVDLLTAVAAVDLKQLAATGGAHIAGEPALVQQLQRLEPILTQQTAEVEQHHVIEHPALSQPLLQLDQTLFRDFAQGRDSRQGSCHEDASCLEPTIRSPNKPTTSAPNKPTISSPRKPAGPGQLCSRQVNLGLQLRLQQQEQSFDWREVESRHHPYLPLCYPLVAYL